MARKQSDNKEYIINIIEQGTERIWQNRVNSKNVLRKTKKLINRLDLLGVRRICLEVMFVTKAEIAAGFGFGDILGSQKFSTVLGHESCVDFIRSTVGWIK